MMSLAQAKPREGSEHDVQCSLWFQNMQKNVVKSIKSSDSWKFGIEKLANVKMW